MILVYLLISGCIILAVGIGIGSYLKIARIARENKEMEEILNKYGKGKATSANPGDSGGGDVSNRL